MVQHHGWQLSVLLLLPRGRGEPLRGHRERASNLTSHLLEVTFELSSGTKGVAVALDEPDVTGGEKGRDGGGVGRRVGQGEGWAPHLSTMGPLSWIQKREPLLWASMEPWVKLSMYSASICSWWLLAAYVWGREEVDQPQAAHPPPSPLAAQKGLEPAHLHPRQAYLGFLQVLHHLVQDGRVVPPGHLKTAPPELVALQLGSHFRV